MSIKLIAVDMDGTFWAMPKLTTGRASSPSHQRMREQNIRFVVASGNQYYQLISFFPEIAHRIAVFVAENGGWVVSGNEDDLQLPTAGSPLQRRGRPSADVAEYRNHRLREAQRLHPQSLTTTRAEDGGGEYYHRLELVDDFNHLDDTILKFGLNVPDSLIPEIQPEAARGAGGHGHRGGHRLRQHRLNYPGVHKTNGLRILQQRWGIEDHEGGGVRRQRQRYRNAAARRVWLCHGQRPGRRQSRRPLSGAA